MNAGTEGATRAGRGGKGKSGKGKSGRGRPGRPGETGPVDPRAITARTMARLESGGGSLATLLPAVTGTLGPHDARRVRAWCHELCRRHHRLDALLGPLLAKPPRAKDRDVRWLLELGLWQALEASDGAPGGSAVAVDAAVSAAAALGKPWARGLVNAVLRRALAERDALAADLDAPARLSHPGWLLDRLAADWPGDWEALVRANDERAPMTLRVAGDPEAYRGRLAAEGIAARPGARSGAALVLEAPVAVERLPGFARGEASVQDESAQLAARLLADASPPGTRLLDACAAPGGKTAHAIETGRFGEIVALDVDPARLARVGETLARIGRADAARLVAADAAEPGAWWDGRPFGAILLDAPCSGTGVVRRHPDIKLLRREDDIGALAALQARLLDALWETLAPGGHLLYATCSVLAEENERQTARFLARTPDAASVALPPEAGRARPLGEAGAAPDPDPGPAPGGQILTGEADSDGFWYALLRRDGTTGSTPPAPTAAVPS